jgi:hypothetical protein
MWKPWPYSIHPYSRTFSVKTTCICWRGWCINPTLLVPDFNSQGICWFHWKDTIRACPTRHGGVWFRVPCRLGWKKKKWADSGFAGSQISLQKNPTPHLRNSRSVYRFPRCELVAKHEPRRASLVVQWTTPTHLTWPRKFRRERNNRVRRWQGSGAMKKLVDVACVGKKLALLHSFLRVSLLFVGAINSVCLYWGCS